MAIYTIPIDTTFLSFVQETTLEGVTYRLLLRWNVRDSYWYLTIRTIEDVEILPSRRLVPGSRLLRYEADYTTRPPGELIVYGGTPDRDSLGKSVNLVYLDEDSTEEILG